MKLHCILAAALLATIATPAFAHPGGHDDFDGENEPSQVECEQLRKMSKEEAEKPAMKQLKQQCARAEIEKAKKH